MVTRRLWLAVALAAAAVAPVAAGCSGSEAQPPALAPFTAGPIDGPLVAYLGQEVCFHVTHTGGAAATVRWSFGDGPAEPAKTGADNACHVWTEPGKRLIAATVATRGQKLVASRGVAVVPQPSDPRPSASSPIAYDSERDQVWVVNPDAGTIARIAVTLAEGSHMMPAAALIDELPACGQPRTLAISGATVAVTCQKDDTLKLFDANQGSATATVDLGFGSEPYGVTSDPRGGFFFVTLQGKGEIAVVEAATQSRVATLAVGPDPRGIAMTADGSLLVTRWRAGAAGATLFVLDATDPRSPLPGPSLLLPPDVGLNSDTDSDGVPSFLNQVVPSPDGGRAVLPSLKANNVTGVFLTSVALTFDTAARAILTEVKLGGPAVMPEERAGGRYAFDDLDYASSVVFSPEGSLIYASIQGAERIEVRDAFSYNVAGSIDGVGLAPQGLAISPDGRLLFVQAFLSRQVQVYDVSDLSQPPQPHATISTVAAEPLPDQVLAGKRIFYRSRDPRMSRTSYLSCASCHLDGEGDHLVWDFTDRGEGLRNTIPLAGRGGIAHGPLHWSANFDEVQDFEHDIRGPMAGTGFMPDDLFHFGTRDTTLGDPKTGVSEELDALAAYVSSLASFGRSPERRDGDPAWEASRQAGKQIFESAEAACASCHTGSRFTDSAFLAGKDPILHDAGTLGPGSGQRLHGPLDGIDTPTLRGLWKSAPYLHDGSAPTLRAVLRDKNVNDLHGKTSHLSDADLDHLETYLLSLDDLEP